MSDDETPPLDETPSDAAAPERATPVYDQAFFLALARPSADTDEARAEARERWNAWRRDPANADMAVTFEGVDFRTEENRGILFAGFEFGDGADFEGVVFGFGPQFRGATFGKGTQFTGAVFGPGANFCVATFGAWARFVDAIFSDAASFVGATFGAGARFDDAIFGDVANFVDTSFHEGASFTGATFDDGARFDGATFRGGADFSGQPVDAFISERKKHSRFLAEQVQSRLSKELRKRTPSVGFDHSRFAAVSFAATRFLGPVSFARRAFELLADFTSVRFDEPPDFDGATNLQRIDFTGARVGFASADRPWWKPHWTTDSRIAVRLRALRSQIEATKNHDFERDLYIEERKAERGIYFDRFLREKRWSALVGHCLWIGVMAAYWALSDYGRSWTRPFAWLVASIPAFDIVYAHLLADRRESAVKAARETVTKSLAGQDAPAVVRGWQTAEAHVRADYDAVVGQLAVSNAVPFVGPLTVDADAKKFLFCGVWPTKGETGAGMLVEPCRPIPPPGFQLATISQNLFSIVLVFFIGLALRNYFRVK